MNPGSLPPLSQKARALLSAEREIPPQPELVRRRALLRARAALWHAQSLPHARAGLVSMWKRVRWLAIAALCATSAVAAWYVGQPTPTRNGASDVTPPPTPAPRSPERAPVSALPPADQDQQEQPSPVRDESQQPTEKAAPPKPAPLRSRATVPQKAAASSEELVMLDKARRAVVLGHFDTALNIIERHTRSFPDTQLGEEREALRVRALKGAGLSKKANQAAREFESRYPKSVLAPELNKSNPRAP